ncbi:hypothetical protein ES319_D13G080900v1 [Gossypium barbadense]|uniref:Sema domain-containing protein n=3 Tax=Gossypium TaxID=3633 RepID=A0A5J5NLA8_GOSBA|nr:hypothetical protein ES319_D13G080900v1 [Gossypium barbadense]TYG36724.1 hypothetical protein ES288_D13G086200v1 [Gossypium darwinii]TYH33826.1 hypothetical protein ES332_D13G086000v1 [Gossypium tomentosum]
MANRFTLFCMRFPPLSFNFTLCFLCFSFDHDYACPPLYLLSPSPWSSLTTEFQHFSINTNSSKI